MNLYPPKCISNLSFLNNTMSYVEHATQSSQTTLGENLSADQQRQLKALVDKYQGIFAPNPKSRHK